MHRALVLAVSAVLIVLGSCGGDSEPSSTATTAGTGSTTASSLDAVEAALLTVADVPGAAAADIEPWEDLSQCYPGNPLGDEVFPAEVNTPSLELTERGVRRSYASGARQGTPEQVRGYVDRFSSEEGSQCLIRQFKSTISASTPGDPINTSGLVGKVTDISAGDGGALLSIAGPLETETDSQDIAFDWVIFRKGSVIVEVLASAVNGPTVPGQAGALADKVARRIP